MEFRQYAARETSELAARLVAAVAERSASDLQGLRDALDMVAGAVDAAIAAEREPDYKSEITALAERLAAEADARAQAACQQVREDAQATIGRLREASQAQSSENSRLQAALSAAREDAERIQIELEEQRKLTEATRAELAKLKEEQQRTQAALKKGEETLADARREMSAIRDRLNASEAQCKELAARNADTSVQLSGLQEAAHERERANSDLQAKLDAAAKSTVTLRKRAEAAERQADRLRSDAELAAQASVRAARALEEAESRAAHSLAGQREAIREQAASFLSVSFDRLLAMYLSVASAASAEDVLAAIVEALAVQFPRVALFRTKDGQVEGVRQVGFDLKKDISKVRIPPAVETLVSQAMASARIETRSGDELADRNQVFGGTPALLLALPLLVDDQAAAVLYADDSGQPPREFAASEIRLKYAQLLQCHAGPLLARLKGERRALAELEEYASLLVNELEQMHAADLGGATMTEAERQARLRDNLEYARQLYAQRSGSSGPAMAGLLEERLLAAAGDRAETHFARDMAALLGAGGVTPQAVGEPASSGS